jgi:hypothetical protein
MSAPRRRACERRTVALQERVRDNEQHARQVFCSKRPTNRELVRLALIIELYHAAVFDWEGLRRPSVEILVFLWTYGRLTRSELGYVMDADADRIRRAVTPLIERGLVVAHGPRLVVLSGEGVLFLRRYLPALWPRSERALNARRGRWAWRPRFVRQHEIGRGERNRPHGGETAQ